MNTAIANTVAAANDKAQYDEYAKRLIAQKIILAHILAKTVDEFRDMKPEDIVAHIEGLYLQYRQIVFHTRHTPLISSYNL